MDGLVNETPHRVLLVEDDAEIRQFCHWALEDEGYLVELATDGLQGLEYAGRPAPSLVVLDMTLPGVSGERVAQALRAAHGAALPILVITADGHASDKAARVGAFGYLTKPFDLEDFLSSVRNGLA